MDFSPPPARFTLPEKKKFDDLCRWIEDHIEEPIGWQQLFAQSGLDFQTLQVMFYRYTNATPMTWIRRKREGSKNALPQKATAFGGNRLIEV